MQSTNWDNLKANRYVAEKGRAVAHAHIYIYNGGRDSNMDFALAEYAMDTSYFSVPRLLVDLARHE